MKKLIIGLIYLFSSHMLMGQDPDLKKKLIYLELFGNTINSVSLNFENVFLQKGSLHFGYRVGIGGLVPEPRTFALPVGFFGFTGKKNLHFEFSAGISYFYGNMNTFNNGRIVDSNSSLFAPINLGYRFQKPDGGIFFRFNINSSIELVQFEEHYRRLSSLPIYFSMGLAIGSTL